MRSSAFLFVSTMLAASGFAGPGVVEGQNGEDGPFAEMTARSIGPAGMSGRVSDVEVVLADRTIVYVGAATGGVFKSVDGGLTW
ncbi:MAG: hypothetical protein HKO77_08360, partial [Gemmatimonadetes bacterium]|nr:hypothetical protein [Gemmatimonadota bacterium]